MAGDSDSGDEIFEDEASRLKDSLKSCRNLLANYRAVLGEGSNDNAPDEDAEGNAESRHDEW